MGRRRREPRAPKLAPYKLITRDNEAGRKMYELLDDLVTKHHDEIINARIVLAWNRSWKPDADGRVYLGKCKKASELDRELAPYDFVIVLRQDFWESPMVKDEQRRALLDHELEHAAVKLDKNGEPCRDASDRVVYRIRKHDIEEFASIVARHGTYKRDLETFATALKLGVRQQELNLDRDERAAAKKDKAQPSAHH
jgi:hypothetical protein